MSGETEPAADLLARARQRAANPSMPPHDGELLLALADRVAALEVETERLRELLTERLDYGREKVRKDDPSAFMRAYWNGYVGAMQDVLRRDLPGCRLDAGLAGKEASDAR